MNDDALGTPEADVPGAHLVRAEHRTVARCDVPTTLNDQMTLARAVANSGILPKHLRGKPENVLAIMYGARALDLPLWQAMQEMHDVDGKIGISANLMRALWLRAGHSFRVIERSNTSATVEAIRIGEDPYQVTFTLDDAKTAGLAGKGNWSKYPKAMLVARATSMCLREIGADILLGFGYTPDELSDGRWDEAELADTKAVVQAAATEAAAWQDVAAAFRAVDDATDEAAVRELGNQFWKAGILDAEREGVTLRQTIENRIAEVSVVDAEVVEDAEPEGNTAAPTPAPGEDGLIDCAKCDGQGSTDGAKCWICLGAGRVAA